MIYTHYTNNNYHTRESSIMIIKIKTYFQCNFCPLTVSSVIPDSKVHVANMGPNWVLSAPSGLHVGPMNFVIRESLSQSCMKIKWSTYPTGTLSSYLNYLSKLSCKIKTIIIHNQLKNTVWFRMVNTPPFKTIVSSIILKLLWKFHQNLFLKFFLLLLINRQMDRKT